MTARVTKLTDEVADYPLKVTNGRLDLPSSQIMKPKVTLEDFEKRMKKNRAFCQEALGGPDETPKPCSIADH